MLTYYSQSNSETHYINHLAVKTGKIEHIQLCLKAINKTAGRVLACDIPVNVLLARFKIKSFLFDIM